MNKTTKLTSIPLLMIFIGAASAQSQSTDSVKPESAPAAPAWPVSGIWMPPDAKDAGALTGASWLSGVKVRGWIDGYYVNNRNRPDRATVDVNQGASAVKGSNVSIEGRTFDIQRNRPSLSLAEIEIEKIPALGGFGFKLDLAAGETQSTITSTIRGAIGPTASQSTIVGPGKNIQHASISYLAPIGSGLRIDAGKLVTHIGAETIETAKNWNYSHAFFYTYAIPFQDTGVRLNYAWSDTLYTELYVVQGWNVTRDNNSGKTWGPSVGWTPAPWLSIVANYLEGPEQNDNTANRRKLFDTQLTVGPFFDRLTFMLNYDRAKEARVPPANSSDARWSGTTLYAKYKINDTFEPTVRIEDYRDPDGFTTGLAQTIRGYTLTWNTKVAVASTTLIMLRPEVRYDRSNADFFTNGNRFRSGRSQITYGIGATLIF
ncbi:outer membrane beta-barrel protein [Pseudoduganella sp. UC29_71]|uniref:outer membrane beta-barrel protein n=1 Tax=Pseudoduganella sp. UC29_71 TaxID=3350174 RepID=UPI00366F5D76